MTLKVKYKKDGQEWEADVWLPYILLSKSEQFMLAQEATERRYGVRDIEIVSIYPGDFDESEPIN